MTELDELSALALGSLIRSRELSSVEITEACLRRIGNRNDELSAFVTVAAESALTEARLADERALRGAPLSALDGVPIAVKDLVAVRGVPTMYGSLAYNDHIPTGDDTIVNRLRSGGLVNLGKTNVPEFGLTCYTESRVAPPALSPLNTDIGAGGSSGGAAVAVAAGMLPLALGSDGGGSIRIPASINGLVGLKTTRGFFAGPARMTDPAMLSCEGPIAGHVVDVAATLDFFAGGNAYVDAVQHPVGSLRIGRYIDNMYGVPVHPECKKVWDKTTNLLGELGHEVVDISCPVSSDTAEAFLATWFIGAAAIDVPPGKEELLTPLTRMLRERGRRYSNTERMEILEKLRRDGARALDATRRFDAVLTPTLAQLPAAVGAIRDDEDPDSDLVSQCEFTPFTSLFNITGQPAMSLPLGAGVDGLPIGIQIAGNLDSEATLMQLAAQLLGFGL